MFADPTLVYGCILESPKRRYLLVQGRTSGKWSFPKGHAHEDEDEFECAKRELYEETGLSAPFMYTRIYHLATGKYYHFKTREEQQCFPLDTREVCSTRWMSRADMKNNPMNVDVNTFLRRTEKESLRPPRWNLAPLITTMA